MSLLRVLSYSAAEKLLEAAQQLARAAQKLARAAQKLVEAAQKIQYLLGEKGPAALMLMKRVAACACVLCLPPGEHGQQSPPHCCCVHESWFWRTSLVT